MKQSNYVYSLFYVLSRHIILYVYYKCHIHTNVLSILCYIILYIIILFLDFTITTIFKKVSVEKNNSVNELGNMNYEKGGRWDQYLSSNKKITGL